jgi:hypothetical protein
VFFQRQLYPFQPNLLKSKSVITNLVSHLAYITYLSVCPKCHVYATYHDVCYTAILPSPLPKHMLFTLARHIVEAGGRRPPPETESLQGSAHTPFTQGHYLLSVWWTDHLVAMEEYYEYKGNMLWNWYNTFNLMHLSISVYPTLCCHYYLFTLMNYT